MCPLGTSMLYLINYNKKVFGTTPFIILIHSMNNFDISTKYEFSRPRLLFTKKLTVLPRIPSSKLHNTRSEKTETN